MVLVCGPRLSAGSIWAAEGIDVKGYVPELYKHLAAADICIVTGGGTITLELTALRRPFLYFPLQQHFEQELDVASRCQRQKAGVKMRFSETTPESSAREQLAPIRFYLAFLFQCKEGKSLSTKKMRSAADDHIREL